MTDSLVVRAAGFSPVKGTRHLPGAGAAARRGRGRSVTGVVPRRHRRGAGAADRPAPVADRRRGRADRDGLAMLLPDGTGAAFEPEPTGETSPATTGAARSTSR